MSITERRIGLRLAAGNLDHPIDRRKLMTAVRLAMGDYVQDDHERKLILGWIFGLPGTELSTRDLTDGQLYALYGWLQIGQDSNGEWVIGIDAWQELQEMVTLIRGGTLVSAAIDPSKRRVNQGGKITDVGKTAEQGSYYSFEA